jgi:hypothetical protein
VAAYCAAAADDPSVLNALGTVFGALSGRG